MSTTRTPRLDTSMPRPTLAATLGLALATAVPAPAVVYRHDVPITDYAAFADQDDFGAVGMIGRGCSATLISPTKILAAGHCSNYSVNETWRDSSFKIYRLDSNGNAQLVHEVEIASWETHPGYPSSEPVHPTDIQIGTLVTPLLGVDPIGIWDGDPLGMTAVVIGHGGQGDGIDGGNSAIHNRKLAGTNVIDRAPTGTLFGYSDYIRYDFDAPNGLHNGLSGSSPTPTAMEAFIDNGDSGGPLLADFGFGYRIVGVNSGVSDADASYGDSSYIAPILRQDTLDLLFKHDVAPTHYQAGQVQLLNASFEFDTFASGKNFTDNVAGWFEIDTAGDINSVATAGESPANRPDTPHGSQWLNLKNPGAAAYQQIGLFDENQKITLDLTLGDKNDREWDGLLVQLFAGQGYGADGIALGSFATLLDEVLIDAATWASFGIDTNDTHNHTLALTLDLLTGFGWSDLAPGDALWLQFLLPGTVGDGEQAQHLIDGLAISVTTIPEPGTLGVLLIGTLAMLRRRRHDSP